LALLKGDKTAAGSYLTSITGDEPANALANDLLGEIYTSDYPAQAFELFMTAGDYTKAAGLAMASLNASRWDEAHTRYLAIHRAGFVRTDIEIGIARATLEKTGRLEDAMPWYDRAIQLDSHYIWTYLSLGDYYKKHNDFASAEKWYNDAIMPILKAAFLIFIWALLTCNCKNLIRVSLTMKKVSL